MNTLLCFNCNKEQDDMLVLGCKHSLCLICSYTLLKRDEKSYGLKFINCDICGDITNIEESTLKEIFSFNNATLNKSFKNDTEIPYKSNSNFNTINQSINMNMNMNNSRYLGTDKLLSANTMKQYCNKHNEETNYFCFDCFCKCICPECIVHGEHKKHEVLNTKKAYPLIIEKANEFTCELSGRINDIGNIYSSINNKKNEVVSISEQIKLEMKNSFMEIRQRLDKKERELLDKADQIRDEQLQEINTYSRLIQSKIVSLNKMIDQINSNLLRRDEIAFINYFAEAKEKIQSFLENNTTNLKLIESNSSIKLNVNTDSLNRMISSLNSIHLEVTYLKINRINENTL